MGKVTTPAGLTYVKEFSFPPEQGFTGSAGGSSVKGYLRGGSVKKDKAPVKKAKGGTTTRDGRDLHSLLYAEGDGLGFMRGGQVKKMGDGTMKTSKMPSMDHGNQPARKGRNQAEIEAGGTPRLKPGYKKGGSIHKVRDSGGGALADAALTKAKHVLRAKKGRMKAPKKGISASKKGMPKNVKAHGGAVEYAQGGSVKK